MTLRELWRKVTRRSSGRRAEDESPEARAKRESQLAGRAGAGDRQLPLHEPPGQEKPRH